MTIYAGIVLYNPDINRLQQSLCSILRQVSGVVLVDNASSNVSEVLGLVDTLQSVILIQNHSNLGIARALNQICEYVEEKSGDWVLTLDQDTVCGDGFIDQLSKFTNIPEVGILCPVVDYEGLSIKSNVQNDDIMPIKACMTSGSLTNLNAWKKVGGFRDDFFIDFVDNEYCMKLTVHKYKILRVCGCVMHHQLGESKEYKFLGLFPRLVSVHHPWRYYYMTRNNPPFIWEYRSRLNIIKEYLKIASILWHGIMYSDEKKKTISFIRRGVCDARHHVMGKLTSL